MAKAKRKPVVGLSAAQCVKALRGRFGSPAYALLEQVANGVGFKANRWADAVAISIWPSRGLSIHGFEIKVSRGDWTRELKDPKKSAEIQGYCDNWWIVAPSGMIEPEELPETWGLIEVDAKLKTKVTVKAPKLKPKPIDRQFLAAIVRRHVESHEAIVKRERSAAREEGAVNGHGTLARDLERERENHRALIEKVEKFEKASGVPIRYEYDIENVGEAVKLVRDAGWREKITAQLAREADAHENMASVLRTERERLLGIDDA
jgi:hypothetical protein